MSRPLRLAVSTLACAIATGAFAGTYDRDPQQTVDQGYTDKIAQYTTGPQFNSPLTNYLPASSTVPTPAKVLGDTAKSLTAGAEVTIALASGGIAGHKPASTALPPVS